MVMVVNLMETYFLKVWILVSSRPSDLLLQGCFFASFYWDNWKRRQISVTMLFGCFTKSFTAVLTHMQLISFCGENTLNVTDFALFSRRLSDRIL